MKSRASVTSASKADEAADEEESVLESQPVQKKYSCGVMCRTSRDGQRTNDILRAIKSKARRT